MARTPSAFFDNPQSHLAANVVDTLAASKSSSTDNVRKFPGDRIKKEQFDNYGRLADTAAKIKDDAASLVRTNGQKGEGTGCRVALFRYPEDVAVDQKEPNHKKPKTSGKKL